MYNRYIPSGASYARIVEEDDFPPAPAPRPSTGPAPRQEEPVRPPTHSEGEAPHRETLHREPPHQEPPSHPVQAPPQSETPAPAEEGKKGGLGKLLKGLKLDDLDTGDILLLLIVLFLFLEGDDMELIITLGLLLILGL